MVDKVCPRCGKSNTAIDFIGSFCRVCFLSNRELYTLQDFELNKCTKCGRLRLRGVWSDPSGLPAYLKEKMRSPYVLEHMATRVVPGSKNLSLEVDMRLLVEGHPVEVSEAFKLPLQKTQCPDCALQSGGYHEAVIQLRGDPEKIERLLPKLVKKFEAATFLSGVNHHKEGEDILVGKKRPALEILSRLGLDYTITNKLVGEKQGKRLYRTTACIRL